MSDIKIIRVFSGSYIANQDRLNALKYRRIKPIRKIMLVTDENHGTGQIKGETKRIGSSYSPVPVCVFRRDTRQLLWETKSKANGSYEFRNIAKGLECFVVAFDPNEEYNAVISDKVVAK